MPKRVLDGEGLWRSDKLSQVQPLKARPEYANILPLAFANGSFECLPRKVWSTVYSYNRPDVSAEDVETFLNAFESAGLLFRWNEPDGKNWAYFTGIEKPGRLPGQSRRKKNEKVGADPPKEALRKFLESKNFPGLGFGIGSGIGIGGKAGGPEIGPLEAQGKPRPSPSVFTGVYLTVLERQDRALAEAFPWVDRPSEYRKADAWLEANPDRCPKRFARFTHNWFNRITKPPQRKEDLNGQEFADALAKNAGIVQ